MGSVGIGRIAGFIIVLTRNNHFRWRCAQFIEGLFKQGCSITATHDNHAFEAIRLNLFSVVFEQINAHPADTRRRFTHGAFNTVLLLNLALFFIAEVFEVFFKQSIQ